MNSNVEVNKTNEDRIAEIEYDLRMQERRDFWLFQYDYGTKRKEEPEED